jgi:hypothetical protein
LMLCVYVFRRGDPSVSLQIPESKFQEWEGWIVCRPLKSRTRQCKKLRSLELRLFELHPLFSRSAASSVKWSSSSDLGPPTKIKSFLQAVIPVTRDLLRTLFLGVVLWQNDTARDEQPSKSCLVGALVFHCCAFFIECEARLALVISVCLRLQTWRPTSWSLDPRIKISGVGGLDRL